MTFRYFAYGSNMHPPRMRERCPSARLIGTGILGGWTAVYDKPSADGSAKRNIRPAAGSEVQGVIYEVEDDDRPALDAAESGYSSIDTPLGLTYAYQGEPTAAPPADWYLAIVESGARAHGLQTDSG